MAKGNMGGPGLAKTLLLDAIIHPDGTIGDITVLRSTNDSFTQSAVAAVRQWRYARARLSSRAVP